MSAPEEEELLTTGEVARRCGVTRDAVLKWVKKGKLPAVRTPGGQFRIPASALQPLTAPGNASGTGSPPHTPGSAPGPGPTAAAMHCWEYFSVGGHPRDACLTCLVYLARAQNCYRLAELGEESGYWKHFCRRECRDCVYYRACQGMATEVLLVSRDQGWTDLLDQGLDAQKVSLRVARTGYEASAVITSFSPALIVLDSALGEVRDGGLVQSILADPRIPSCSILIGIRTGHEDIAPLSQVPGVPAPFPPVEMEKLAEGAIRPVVGSPRGAA